MDSIWICMTHWNTCTNVRAALGDCWLQEIWEKFARNTIVCDRGVICRMLCLGLLLSSPVFHPENPVSEKSTSTFKYFQSCVAQLSFNSPQIDFHLKHTLHIIRRPDFQTPFGRKTMPKLFSEICLKCLRSCCKLSRTAQSHTSFHFKDTQLITPLQKFSDQWASGEQLWLPIDSFQPALKSSIKHGPYLPQILIRRHPGQNSQNMIQFSNVRNPASQRS